jgi:hypothetical protein
MTGVIVEVSARKFAVPFECPCCGSAPDAEMYVAVPRGRELSPESARGQYFPYCQGCTEHAKRYESAGMVSAGVMVGAIALAVIVGLATQLVFGLLVFLGAIPIAVVLASSRRSLAAADCSEACAAPGKAVQYLGWTGTVSSFAFASPTYTARFAEQNQKILINQSDQLRKLLDGYKIARAAVPTPAQAVTIPPPATVTDWISKVEAAKGRAERRNVLSRALDAIRDESDRQRLIESATRVELATFRQKLDQARGPARKSLLQSAINEVRADNLPDELQAAALSQLEQQLSQL